jgi:Rhodanese-like domain
MGWWNRNAYGIALAGLVGLLPLTSVQGTPIGNQGSAQDPQEHQEAAPADAPRISVDELILMQSKKTPMMIIDVRVKDSYSEKIRGAVQIPLDEIETHLKDIPRDKEVITYCA